MELIWGDGFMAPGGEGNVDNLVEGLELQGKQVLDIGCGLGRPACILAKKYGAYVVGTDLESHLIDRSKQRAKAMGLVESTDFMVVKPGPLEFADESFDVIVSSGAFTQIHDKLGMYKECLRVLKPGGVLSCYDWMKSEGESRPCLRIHLFDLIGRKRAYLLKRVLFSSRQQQKLINHKGHLCSQIMKLHSRPR